MCPSASCEGQYTIKHQGLKIWSISTKSSFGSATWVHTFPWVIYNWEHFIFSHRWCTALFPGKIEGQKSSLIEFWYSEHLFGEWIHWEQEQAFSPLLDLCSHAHWRLGPVLWTCRIIPSHVHSDLLSWVWLCCPPVARTQVKQIYKLNNT